MKNNKSCHSSKISIWRSTRALALPILVFAFALRSHFGVGSTKIVFNLINKSHGSNSTRRNRARKAHFPYAPWVELIGKHISAFFAHSRHLYMEIYHFWQNFAIFCIFFFNNFGNCLAHEIKLHGKLTLRIDRTGHQPGQRPLRCQSLLIWLKRRDVQPQPIAGAAHNGFWRKK